RAGRVDHPDAVRLDRLLRGVRVVVVPGRAQPAERRFDRLAVLAGQPGRGPHHRVGRAERHAVLVDELALAQEPLRVRVEGARAGALGDVGRIDPLTGEARLVLVEPSGRHALVEAAGELVVQRAGLAVRGAAGGLEAEAQLGGRDHAAATPAEVAVVLEVVVTVAWAQLEE